MLPQATHTTWRHFVTEGAGSRAKSRARRLVANLDRVTAPALVSTGASPAARATASPSSVADITSRRRSSRRALCMSRHSASAKIGLQAALVEFVENHQADTCRATDHAAAYRLRIPSVTTSMRVAGPTLLVQAHAIADGLHRRAHRGGAMKRAAARAARRRGSSMTILLSPSHAHRATPAAHGWSCRHRAVPAAPHRAHRRGCVAGPATGHRWAGSACG